MDAIFTTLAPFVWLAVPCLAAWFYNGARRDELSWYLAAAGLGGAIILIMTKLA